MAAALPRGVDADLLAALFEQPCLRIRTGRERCGVSHPTATRWLEALRDAGVVRELLVGRDRVVVDARFLDILFSEADG